MLRITGHQIGYIKTSRLFKTDHILYTIRRAHQIRDNPSPQQRRQCRVKTEDVCPLINLSENLQIFLQRGPCRHHNHRYIWIPVFYQPRQRYCPFHIWYIIYDICQHRFHMSLDRSLGKSHGIAHQLAHIHKHLILFLVVCQIARMGQYRRGLHTIVIENVRYHITQWNPLILPSVQNI